MSVQFSEISDMKQQAVQGFPAPMAKQMEQGMPLTPKGSKIMSAMKSEYGDKKGTSIFYASRNKETIKGVDPESKPTAKRRHRVRFPHPSIKAGGK